MMLLAQLLPNESVKKKMLLDVLNIDRCSWAEEEEVIQKLLLLLQQLLHGMQC